MQHYTHAGLLEVDHFNPLKKKDMLQAWGNLFPASRYCNGKKGDHWPTKAERAAGCRFLNPCEESDYGEQIFEDAASHRLLGTSPAAIWHIRICGLNAEHLIGERAKRAEYLRLLNKRPFRLKSTFAKAGELISSFRAEVELMIPEIPPPPTATR